MAATSECAEPLTLADVLADIPDPRDPRGRIHPLPAVLGLIVLGLLMGRTTIAGISRLGRLFGAPLAHALGFRRGKTPAKSTFSELIRDLDPDQLEAALSRYVRSRVGADFDHLAIDGKAARGSRDGDVPGHHFVAAYAPQVEAVLAQIRVDCKTNEHKAALRLLGLLPVKGRIVTGDAMFCQRDLVEQVVDSGGDYVLIAKDNQPGVAIDVNAGFGFETAARSIAAAFSPSGGAPPTAPEPDRPDGGQGTRAA